MARSTSSTIGKFVLGLLVAVLILVLVAEFGLRWFVGKELRDGFRAEAQEQGTTLSEDPTIAFGASPLLVSAVRGVIPEVEITTPSTLSITQGELPEITGSPAAHVELTDLRISDPDNPVAAHMVTTTEVPEDYLLATIQRSMAEQQSGAEGMGALVQGLIQVTDLTANPAGNTLDVEFTDGAATLNLTPVPVDGRLTFEATGASLFGFDLPEQVTDMISRGLAEGVTDQNAQVNIDTFEVIDNGARVVVSGENLNLNAIAGSASAVEQR